MDVGQQRGRQILGSVRGSLLGAGTDDVCLVGKHDRLDAVAEIQLLEHARDVRLDGEG